MSAYSPANVSHFLLWEGVNLSNTTHALYLNNLGNGVLVDFALEQSLVGAPGATLTNTTVQDSDHKTLTYSGAWTSNNDTRFSGGTSTYTNVQGASVALNFNGSAVYVLGDTVFDHGTASFNLDGVTTAFNFSTEFLAFDTLKFFAGNLSSRPHSLVITNIGPGFFDLDSIVYTVPSSYATSSSPTTVSPSSSTSSISGSTASSSSVLSPASASTTPAKSASAPKLGARVILLLGFTGLLAAFVI